MNRFARRILGDAVPLALPRAADKVSERWWSLPPRIRLAVIAGAALLLVLAVGARIMLSPYGPPEQVLISRTYLAAGTVVEAADVEQARWPRDIVPATALTASELAEGALRLSAPVPRGGVLTADHLAGGGIAGLVPDGRVAVPLGSDVLPPLSQGTRFDLVTRDQHARGVVVARDAMTIADDGDVIWVAVAPTDGAAVAAAASGGMATIIPVVQPPHLAGMPSMP